MIGEQELREAEDERADEGDLKRDEDVLASRSEEHEHGRGRSRDPRAYACSTHDRAQKRRRDEMQHDCEELVRQVGTETEDLEQDTEHERGQCDEVIAVPLQQIVRCQPTPCEEVPFVAGEAEEPDIAALNHVEDETNELQTHKRDTRAPAGWPPPRCRAFTDRILGGQPQQLRRVALG